MLAIILSVIIGGMSVQPGVVVDTTPQGFGVEISGHIYDVYGEETLGRNVSCLVYDNHSHDVNDDMILYIN